MNPDKFFKLVGMFFAGLISAGAFLGGCAALVFFANNFSLGAVDQFIPGAAQQGTEIATIAIPTNTPQGSSTRVAQAATTNLPNPTATPISFQGNFDVVGVSSTDLATLSPETNAERIDHCPDSPQDGSPYMYSVGEGAIYVMTDGTKSPKIGNFDQYVDFIGNQIVFEYPGAYWDVTWASAVQKAKDKAYNEGIWYEVDDTLILIQFVLPGAVKLDRAANGLVSGLPNEEYIYFGWESFLATFNSNLASNPDLYDERIFPTPDERESMAAFLKARSYPGSNLDENVTLFAEMLVFAENQQIPLSIYQGFPNISKPSNVAEAYRMFQSAPQQELVDFITALYSYNHITVRLINLNVIPLDVFRSAWDEMRIFICNAGGEQAPGLATAQAISP